MYRHVSYRGYFSTHHIASFLLVAHESVALSGLSGLVFNFRCPFPLSVVSLCPFSWPNPAHFLPFSLPVSLTIILKDVSITQGATVSPSKRSKTVTKFGSESQTHIKIQARMHIEVSLLIEFSKDKQSLSDNSWDPWSPSSERDFLFYQSFNL